MAKIALAVGFGLLGAVTGGLGYLGWAGLAAGASSAMIGGAEGSDFESLIFPGEDHAPTPEHQEV